jgi:hypothetical protein
VSAPYTINHAEESTTVRVNQQTNGNRWNLLGEFRFGPGTAGNVVLTDEGVASADIVSADAVRFVLIQPDEEPTPGSTVGWLVQ